MATKKIERWITVNGKHIPILQGQSKEEAIEEHVKSGKKEDKKKEQIEKSKKSAKSANKKGRLTKLEVMKANKEDYAAYSKKINGMHGIEKVVAEEFVLAWLKNSNWLGGLSDSAWMKIAKRVAKKHGYTFDEMYDEFERQLGRFR